MPTPEVQDTLNLLGGAGTKLHIIKKQIKNDPYTDKDTKKTITGEVDSLLNGVLKKKKSLTSFPMGNIRSMNLPLLPQARAVHVSAQDLVIDASKLQARWENISGEAEKLAIMNNPRLQAQSNGTSKSDSARVEHSPASGNSTNVTINRRLYNVTADDKFTYNSAPSLPEPPYSVTALAPHAPSEYPSPAHPSRIPDSESRRQYYPHVPPSHNESTIARTGYSGPDPGDRSVSSQKDVQIGESQTPPVQVGVGHMAGSGNYTTGRDGRQHHANPSVWSNMSDPPRAPSSVSIRPSLPAPPRRQRREVETVETPEVLPSSSSQRSSGRDSVGTILSEQSSDSYAAGRRFHWDDKPIMLRDSFIQAEHRRLHSTDQSIELEWTEGNNSSENLDEDPEYY